MSERFYINSPLGMGPVTLQGPEAHHLASVCRASPGDSVHLFNGDGKEYRGRVVAVHKRIVDLEIEAIAEPRRELSFRLEIAVSLPRGDRGQFLIEKLTELGVAALVPLECQRTVVHPGGKKLEKMERHVIEASKQCGRNVLMAIESPLPWSEYCLPRSEHESRWMAHPGERQTRAGRHEVVRVAIGPEGGFTDSEVALGLQHGWQLLGLGPRILRVETAAIAAAVLAAG